MKKTLFTFPILFACVSQAQTTNPAPYCNSTYGLPGSTPVISIVNLASLSNSTAHCAAPGYIYYNNLGATSIAQSSMQTIKVTLANYDNETAVKGWIDFNANNVFEPSEKIIVVNQGSVGFGPTIVKQANFTVPANAATGITRMRISVGWHFADNNQNIFKLDSCHTAAANEYSAGETEDYDISITLASGVESVTDGPPTFFPDPAADKIFFSVPVKDVSIYNYCGVKLREYASEKTSVDVAELASGVYFIAARYKNTLFFRKFIKQ